MTTTLYIFSFYNEDISDTLQGMTIDDKAATIELYYEPEEDRLTDTHRVPFEAEGKASGAKTLFIP